MKNINNNRKLLLFLLVLLIVTLACGPEISDTNNEIEEQTEPTIAETQPTTKEVTPTSSASPEPTPTEIPTQTLEPTPTIEVVINVLNLLGKPVDEVENIIGQPVLITPNDDYDDKLSGGEFRDYELDQYTVFITYDKNGIARVFQVLDGLASENHSLSDWNRILPQFGVSINSPPDRRAPAGYHWNNFNGFYIGVIASSSSGSPVWTVQISEVEYKP